MSIVETTESFSDLFEPDYRDVTFISEDDSVTNDARFVSKLGDTDTGVPGRLLGKTEFYLEVRASQYIVDTVSHGYKLIFKDDQPPPRFIRRNNRSALENSSFVYKELKRLESLGCIRSVKTQPHIVNPVSCVYSKKWRCVLDASLGLNPFCLKRKIQLSDLKSIDKILEEGDFMTVSDLDSGYWHVPIHPSHQEFLGLHFVHDNGEVEFWVWVCMPLGIIDAAFIFTKLIKPIMSFLHEQGKRSSIYIDDLINFGKTYRECADQEIFIHKSFLRGGWIFKPEKSSGPPSQTVQYLGLIINSVSMKFEIPQKKFDSILEEATFFLDISNNRIFPVKRLASWVGKLQSLRLAIGPVVSIMCRALYQSISDARTWSSFISLGKNSIFEIRWWYENLQFYTCYPINVSSSSIVVDAQISSDSSGVGFFSVSLTTNEKLKSGPFTSVQSKSSSTWRELFAVHQTWTDVSICSKYQGLTVKHFTDSKSVFNILSKGSKVQSLQVLVREIFLSLRSFCINLIPVWLSRAHEYIELSDRGSREYRSDDYSLTNSCLTNILENFPPVTFDAMASSTNTISQKFYSRYPSLNSVGVDIFAQSLDYSEFYFVFPPVSLCVKVLKFFAKQQVRGILILPLWPSAVWFNFFFPDGAHCAQWVGKIVIFQPSYTSLLDSPSCFSECVGFKAIALQFDFRKSDLVALPKLSSDFCLLGGCGAC